MSDLGAKNVAGSPPVTGDLSWGHPRNWLSWNTLTVFPIATNHFSNIIVGECSQIFFLHPKGFLSVELQCKNVCLSIHELS